MSTGVLKIMVVEMKLSTSPFSRSLNGIATLSDDSGAGRAGIGIGLQVGMEFEQFRIGGRLALLVQPLQQMAAPFGEIDGARRQRLRGERQVAAKKKNSAATSNTLRSRKGTSSRSASFSTISRDGAARPVSTNQMTRENPGVAGQIELAEMQALPPFAQVIADMGGLGSIRSSRGGVCIHGEKPTMRIFLHSITPGRNRIASPGRVIFTVS